jgi:hypothetical protein
LPVAVTVEECIPFIALFVFVDPLAEYFDRIGVFIE